MHQSAAPKTGAAKEVGSVRSRHLHYLNVATALGWDDDLTLTAACAGGKTRRGTLQLAMYAHVLAAGCNLVCRSLKAGTIKNYVRAVAQFLSLLSGDNRDYRLESPNATKCSPLLDKVFQGSRGLG